MEGSVSYTIENVLEAMGSLYTLLLTFFGKVADTILGNPLLFVPVLIAFMGGLAFFAIKVFRRLGVRGVSSRR